MVDPDLPVFTTVGAAGRYLVLDGRLEGADNDDPLVAELAARTPDDLASAVRAAA